MRLYNVYYLCKVSIDGIKGLDYRKNDYPNGQSDITVLGWKKAVQSYEIVSEIDFLKEEVEVLQAAIPAYAQNAEDPNVSMATYNAIRSWNYQLLTKIQAIIDLHESVGDTVEAQAGIDIKIPKCDSFKEYIQYLKDLDFVFSQCPLISQSSEEIVFNTVDVAPMWLSFFIKAEKGQNYILSTLSKMTEVAMKVKSNWVVVKQQEAILKRLQQSNEIGAEVLEAYKKVKNAMLDDSVTDLETACESQITNPEDRDRAARSIEIFAQLIEKGAEIYCSINTPEEIKVQFPFTENAPIIPEGLLQLVEKKENVENTANTPMAQSTQSVEASTSVQEIDSIPITGTVQTGVQTTGPIQFTDVAQVAGAAQQSADTQAVEAPRQSIDVMQTAGVQQSVDVAQAAGVQQSVDVAQAAGVAQQGVDTAQQAEAVQNADVTSFAVPVQNTESMPGVENVPAEEHVQDIGSLLNIETPQPEPAAEDIQDVGNLLNTENVQDVSNLLNTENVQDVSNLLNTGEVQDVGHMLNTESVQDVGNLLNTDGVQDVGNLLTADGVQDVGNLLNTGNAQNEGNAQNTDTAGKIEDDEERADVLKYI